MNFKSKLVSVFGAGIIALSMVGGVAAQQNSAQVNVQVNKPQDGTLTYTVQAQGFSTAASPTLDQSSTVSGTLILTVTDGRLTREGWTITMSATDFTSEGKPSFNADALAVTPKDAVKHLKGDKDLPIASGNRLSNQGAPVLQASRGKGSGQYTATYDANVTVPANTQEGVYKTTITVSHGAGPN
jgi:hypothetical protein